MYVGKFLVDENIFLGLTNHAGLEAELLLVHGRGQSLAIHFLHLLPRMDLPGGKIFEDHTWGLVTEFLVALVFVDGHQEMESLLLL